MHAYQSYLWNVLLSLPIYYKSSTTYFLKVLQSVSRHLHLHTAEYILIGSRNYFHYHHNLHKQTPDISLFWNHNTSAESKHLTVQSQQEENKCHVLGRHFCIRVSRRNCFLGLTSSPVEQFASWCLPVVVISRNSSKTRSYVLRFSTTWKNNV